MPVRAHMPGYRWFHVFRDAAVRTGVYSGSGLSIVFTVWLIIANHVSFLERFAMARNLAAAVLLCFLAAVPVLRFFRSPGNLIASSLIGWAILTAWYRLLCTVFSKLSDWHSTFQVFMYGTVIYLIVATACWIGTIIWRARSHHISHSNHHHVS